MDKVSQSQVDEVTPLNGNKVINYSETVESVQSDQKYDLSSSSEENIQFKFYKRRWWILFAFCMASLSQSILWNTWSPLLDAVLIAYKWPDSFVAMLPAASDLGYVIFAFPLMYVVETSDLRHGLIIASSLLVFCGAGWLISLPTGQTWLIAVGAALNGITACITMAGPPLLSVTWFPMSERTTATAIAAMSGYAGSGVAFLTSPYISGANVTAKDVENRNSLSKEFVGELQTGIQNVVYFGAAIATVSFLMIVIYFPPRPPTPPSRSQTREREDFWSGIKHLLQNGHFWLLNIAFNLPNGTFNAWIPLCSVNFRSLGVDEVTAGWVGFTSMISSVIGSVVMSAVIDRMKRKMKLSCIILGTLSLVILAILVCIQEHYIYVPKEAVTAVVYVLCISASLCINGAIPIYYEMGCELAFPVHEGLTCSLLTLTNNLFGMLFFLIFLVPSLAANTEWMTWVCVGTCGLTTPLLLFMKERFSRLDIEDSGRSSPSVTIET